MPQRESGHDRSDAELLQPSERCNSCFRLPAWVPFEPQFTAYRIAHVDLALGRDEVREAGIGKIQHEMGTPDEVDEVVNEAQIYGSNRTDILPPSGQP